VSKKVVVKENGGDNEALAPEDPTTNKGAHDDIEETGCNTSTLIAPIRDTDTPIPIQRYVDTAFSKNKDTPIRQVYKYIQKIRTIRTISL
jgi:hypothetical protein